MPRPRRSPGRPRPPVPDGLTPAQRLRLADAMCRDAARLAEAGRKALRSLTRPGHARP